MVQASNDWGRDLVFVSLFEYSPVSSDCNMEGILALFSLSIWIPHFLHKHLIVKILTVRRCLGNNIKGANAVVILFVPNNHAMSWMFELFPGCWHLYWPPQQKPQVLRSTTYKQVYLFQIHKPGSELLTRSDAFPFRMQSLHGMHLGCLMSCVGSKKFLD